MSEYYIPPEVDFTQLHFQLVLGGKYPELQALQRALHDVQIDRVLQAFIDAELVSKGHLPAERLVGMVDMGTQIRKFLSNIAQIRAVEESNEPIESEDTLDLTGVSANDVKLAVSPLIIK